MRHERRIPTDPPRRKDGRCALRGCKRKLVAITPRHRKYGGAAILMEPFCSTECCKRFYGLIEEVKDAAAGEA